MKELKIFRYDVLIDEKNFCDRVGEIKALAKRSRDMKKTILFAPRRYGKTSLVRNVVGSRYKKMSSNHMLVYIDLMDVQSFESIAQRIQQSLSKSLIENFPVKTLIKNVAGLIKNLSTNIEFDPVSGMPSIGFSIKNFEIKNGLQQLFEAIKELSKKYHMMLVLDEFHDISFVPEAEALFRGFLQELDSTTVFILGSKKHLLKLMFENANSPLFNYGDEVHLNPISVDDWLFYFQERLSQVDVKIEKEEISWITEQMCDVPNAICELGAWLMENFSKTKLSTKTIKSELYRLVDSKQSFHYLLQGYTENERNVLRKLAANRYVLEPQSMSFLDSLGIPKSSVAKILTKLMDLGAVEYEPNKGYRISDPILGFFLATH
ncbi:MAG: ATP-binding protein [Pseudomonadota bacterium]